VYLGYAGPYSSSPASAFGHLFLVVPSGSDNPLPLWEVVTFGADTQGAGPLRFIGVGVFGGFLGSYQRVPFHEKITEYEQLQDRDLWLVRLILTDRQRGDLAERLAGTSGQWYPYTFFGQNCAYYLQLLLAEAIGTLPEPRGITSPIAVIEAAFSSGIAGPAFYRRSWSGRLRQLSGDLSADVKARLTPRDWLSTAADTSWISGLSADDRHFVQQYFAGQASGLQSPVSAESNRGIALLRLLNGRAGLGRSNLGVESIGEPIPSPLFHRYGRFSFSSLNANKAGPRLSVRYRAALHDFWDSSLGHRPINAMDLLAIEVSSPVGRVKPRIEQVVLFSQRALGPSDWITSRKSWMLELLGRRGGLYGADVFQLEARVGVGKTIRAGRSSYLYGLATLAGLGVVSRDIGISPGWEFGVAWQPGSRWSAGLRWSRETHFGNWSRFQQRLITWIRRDFGQFWGIRVGFLRGPTGNYSMLGIDWYPFSQ
jgi:hypothetical protein